MWRNKLFLGVNFLLFLGLGCQLAGPYVVDPYYQAKYRPAPDDWIELRRVELTEKGEIVARGIAIGYPQPMVQVTAGFRLVFRLPNDVSDLSVIVVDELPSLSVVGSPGTYAQMVDDWRERDVASPHQRIGVAMLRDGPYRRWLTPGELERGEIPTMNPDSLFRIYYEAGGYDGYLSVGMPPPEKATMMAARAVLLGVQKKHARRKHPEDRREYLFIGRVREGERQRILRLQLSGEFLKRWPE
jgi:hypothetical protein